MWSQWWWGCPAITSDRMALCSAPSMPRCWRTDRGYKRDAASGIDRASAQRWSWHLPDGRLREWLTLTTDSGRSYSADISLVSARHPSALPNAGPVRLSVPIDPDPRTFTTQLPLNVRDVSNVPVAKVVLHNARPTDPRCTPRTKP